MIAPRIVGIVACLSFVAAAWDASPVGAQAGQETAQPAAPKKLDRASLERQFEETLSGATLIGTFTVTGQNADNGKKLNEEKYTINEVKKIKDDLWQFKARIQYGGHDLTVPLALEVKWAGDTPVITLTDMPVPGFGTFTARVLIYRGEYAGTWSGGDHGGQLFGRIVKKGEPLDKPEEKTGSGSAESKPKP
ncbi:MAG: hypothetical protein HYX69_12180 [Planctomycetia bacterium]|nr:hypothetical protein [Planctomycetia bacterium]